jgi:hypothetical protein
MREWEVEFIQHWEAGETCEQIGAALGIPAGTASSRAHTLQREGKIQPRPKGGKRVWSNTPAQAPAPTPAGPPAPTREAPAITMVAVPELREIISRFSALEARVAAIENGTRGATRTPPAETPALTRTPGTIKQWTVRLSQPLIDAVKAQASTEGKEPSHLVEELLWQALTDRQSATP